MPKQNVLQYLQQHEDEMVEFLKRLIRINSENGGDDVDCARETEIGAFLYKELTDAGFSVDRFAADKKGERHNLCAVLHGKEKGRGRDIILNAHMDTVMVTEREKWHVDPFGAEEKDGRIYGRGANDMKAGLTAAVYAAKAIRECGEELGGDIVLMLTVGEESCEGGTIGTRACVKRGHRAPFAIVCEPTSLEIHNATASLLCFELIIQGKAIHTCCRNQVIFPQSSYQTSGETVGVDAVEKALPFLEFFYRLEKEWNHRWNSKSAVGTGGKPRHDAQGIGAFNINPSFVESGTYIAAVPGSIKITYALWHPPEVDYKELMDEIRHRVSLLAQTDDWLIANPPEVIGPVAQLWPGFVTDEESEAVITLKNAYRDAVGREAVVSGFRAVCDGTYLVEEGIPSIVCGPGALNDGAHGYNEFVPRSEVLDAARIYASFICDWCG